VPATGLSISDAERLRAFERQGHDALAATYHEFFTPVTAMAIEPLLDAVEQVHHRRRAQRRGVEHLGDAQLADLADGGNDRFIDAMVLWGDADTIKRGLRAHFEAGATHVCLQPVHADGDFAARDRMLAVLADT